jgi:hypothetical protein
MRILLNLNMFASLTRHFMSWYSKFSGKLKQIGFKESKANTSLFIYDKQGVTMFLSVYVDDIINTSSSPAAVDALL